MLLKKREICSVAGAFALIFLVAQAAHAQDPSESLPNPYQVTENWAKLPEGRVWGAAAGLSVDKKGNVWAFDRCGAAGCANSNVAPILEFNPAGQLITSFGGGIFVQPHGIYVDKDGNVWATDDGGNDGKKGQQIFKFSPTGKVLLTLGTAGVEGDGPNTFNHPVGVVVAPNGDIFVADGHGGKDSNARIVKFSKHGKFIKTWGTKGSGPGEFDGLHTIAMDSKGRVFVGDRSNERIQIFDQDGNYITEWKQFGRPTSIFIDKKDTIYVTDNLSNSSTTMRKGIRIGSAVDGSVKVFIPFADQNPKDGDVGAESIAADANGIVYAIENPKEVWKFVKQ